MNDTQKNIDNARENTTSNKKQKNIAHLRESNSKITPDNTQKTLKKDSQNVQKSISLSKHVTGKRTIGVIMLLIVLGIVAIKYIRRD